MGMYKYIRDAWKSADSDETYRVRMIEWRKEPVTVRIERPTRLDRARSLGYRAKQGFILVRQRVSRGGRMRENFTGGRRQKHSRMRKVLDKSYKMVAEERANKVYPNCEVLNSYFLSKDGKHYWFEVILVDRASPNIKKDKKISWISETQHKGRVYRALTSAGKKTQKTWQ